MLPRYSPENFEKNMELVHSVEAIAKKKGCTPGQIAINWILSLSKRPGMPTIIPIPGSSNPERIRENATIVDLTEEDLAELEKVLAAFVPAGPRYPKLFQAHLNL
jgi:pyridoxine 4-dehydrogenase